MSDALYLPFFSSRNQGRHFRARRTAITSPTETIPVGLSVIIATEILPKSVFTGAVDHLPPHYFTHHLSRFPHPSMLVSAVTYTVVTVQLSYS